MHLFRQIHTVRPAWPRLLRLLGLVLLFLACFGTAIHFIEPETFPGLFDGIWWAIVTASTIGYGDLVPVTPPGRLLAAVLILSGAGLVTSYFASISAMAASSEQSYMAGKKGFKGTGHLIIVGWNERSRFIIGELHEQEQQLPIVLIDDSLSKHPMPRTNIHFVHGKAAEDRILEQAGIKTAGKILITADLQKNEFQTDMFSVLTLVAVKGLNPDLYCLVEILTAEQKQNAIRAGADCLIQSNLFASRYMLDSLHSKQNPDAIRKGDTFLQVKALPLNSEWEGLTLKQLGHILLEQEIYLSGVIRGGKRIVNAPLEWDLLPDDEVLILSEEGY